MTDSALFIEHVSFKNICYSLQWAERVPTGFLSEIQVFKKAFEGHLYEHLIPNFMVYLTAQLGGK